MEISLDIQQIKIKKFPFMKLLTSWQQNSAKFATCVQTKRRISAQKRKQKHSPIFGTLIDPFSGCSLFSYCKHTQVLGTKNPQSRLPKIKASKNYID